MCYRTYWCKKLALILINLSKKFKTIGYDINKQRIEDLKKGKDLFNEF